MGEPIKPVAWLVRAPGLTDAEPMLEGPILRHFKALAEFDERYAVEPIYGPEAASRIAELEAKLATADEEVERWISAYNIAHDQAIANGSKLATAVARLNLTRDAFDCLDSPLTEERDVADFAKTQVRLIDRDLASIQERT